MQKEVKKYWKAFAVFFLISFLIINWNTISWVFNYMAVTRYLSDIFEKEDPAIYNNPDPYINPDSAATSSANTASGMPNTNLQNTKKPNGIEIPKIGISAPLIVNESLSDAQVHTWLDKGVVHYPGTAMPGEVGQTIILGHSAPANWPMIKYDWVFSDLNDLQSGDRVFVYFNNKKIEYSVTEKKFLDRGDEVPQDGLANTKNVLILISCWPPGKNIQRIAVEAVLQ